MVILFSIFAVLAIVGAMGMVLSRTPVYSILWLILNFFSLGGLYLSLGSEFLAIVQVIIYAGAIMVLFLFVVMLLNLSREHTFQIRLDFLTFSAVLVGILFLYAVTKALLTLKDVTFHPSFEYGKVEPIGSALMRDYVFPFEMISVILLVAVIGAIVIAKKYRGL
jgi:NADH-quinone oxidoreductase subunit J